MSANLIDDRRPENIAGENHPRWCQYQGIGDVCGGAHLGDFAQIAATAGPAVFGDGVALFPVVETAAKTNAAGEPLITLIVNVPKRESYEFLAVDLTPAHTRMLATDLLRLTDGSATRVPGADHRCVWVGLANGSAGLLLMDKANGKTMAAQLRPAEMQQLAINLNRAVETVEVQ